MSEYLLVVESDKEEENMVPFPPLPSCELSVSVKEDQDRQKTFEYLRISTDIEIVYGNCS